MRAVLTAVVAVLLQSGAGATAAAQTTTKHVISLAAADKIAGAAEAEAKRRGSTVVIVVVDDGGYPIVLRRLDDTQVASVEVGIGKARTAAIFRRPSGVFEEQVRKRPAVQPGPARLHSATGRCAHSLRGKDHRRDRGERQHAEGGRGDRARRGVRC